MAVQYIRCEETKEFIMWLRSVQADLVSWMSGYRVPSQASEQILKTEYNYYPIRPKHWQTYKDPHVFQLTLTFQLLPKINDFRETWLSQFTLEKKSFGNRNTISTLWGRGSTAMAIKKKRACFPFWLAVMTWSGFCKSHCYSLHKIDLSKLLITAVHIWLYVHLGT